MSWDKLKPWGSKTPSYHHGFRKTHHDFSKLTGLSQDELFRNAGPYSSVHDRRRDALNTICLTRRKSWDARWITPQEKPKSFLLLRTAYGLHWVLVRAFGYELTWGDWKCWDVSKLVQCTGSQNKIKLERWSSKIRECGCLWKSYSSTKVSVFPQIAITIGVLTSNTGGGRRTTFADWTWHQGAIAGSEDAVPLLGAIAGCHCSVLLLWGEGDDQLWGVDVVPLLGAIAGCHCRVLWWGGWRPTLKEWTWCHCRVPLSCAMVGGVTTNFEGVDMVPLQGAIVVCYGLGGGWRPTLGEWTWCHC